jgi:hypothetical protein
MVAAVSLVFPLFTLSRALGDLFAAGSSGYILKTPVLHLIGASDAAFTYTDDYFSAVSIFAGRGRGNRPERYGRPWRGRPPCLSAEFVTSVRKKHCRRLNPSLTIKPCRLKSCPSEYRRD